MVLEVVGGAVLGPAVRELLKAVTDAMKKTTNFQQVLTRLESTLRSVIPRVEQISQLNNQLNIPDEDMKEVITILQNGQALVNKCSQISTIRKGQYSKQLLDLDYSLLRYFQTILPLDHVRDTKEMLLMVRELHKGLVVGAKDEGESSNSPPFSEIQPCKDSNKNTSKEMKKELLGAKDEGESSKSGEDPEEKEAMYLITEIEEIKVNQRRKGFWKFWSKGCINNNDQEELTYLIEEPVKMIPEIEEIKVNDQGKDTWMFELKGCIYNFDLEDINYYMDGRLLITEKRRYNVTDCECDTKHGKVMVISYQKEVEKSEFEHQMEILAKLGNHPNIVPPIGYCFHKSGTLLFYDYFPKGKGNLFSELHEFFKYLYLPLPTMPECLGRRADSYEYSRPDLKWNSKLKIREREMGRNYNCFRGCWRGCTGVNITSQQEAQELCPAGNTMP